MDDRRYIMYSQETGGGTEKTVRFLILLQHDAIAEQLFTDAM